MQALRHDPRASAAWRAGEKFSRTRGHRTNIGEQLRRDEEATVEAATCSYSVEPIKRISNNKEFNWNVFLVLEMETARFDDGILKKAVNI